MKKFLAVFAVLAITALTGCQLFKPTPAGDCPQVTTTAASLIAYGGTLAALEAGAPPAVLSKISSNISASIQDNKFNADLINIAIANSGGAKWAQYLGGAALLFKNEFNAVVNSNLTSQVCAMPTAQNIVAGMNQALLIWSAPRATQGGLPPQVVVAPFRAANKK